MVDESIVLRASGAAVLRRTVAVIRYTTGFSDSDRVFAMTQDELKALVAQAAADYVLANVPAAEHECATG